MSKGHFAPSRRQGLTRVGHGAGNIGLSAAAVICAGLAACVGIAGAAPIGQITEFPAPLTNPAQVVAGPHGNLWFSDRNGAVGQIATNGTVTRFTSGLNPGSAVRSIGWVPTATCGSADSGTTRAV